MQSALERSEIREIRVETSEEIGLFATLSKINALGAGECSAIAACVCQGYVLAIDDRRARNEATRHEHRVVTTADLVIRFVRARILSIDQADAFKNAWEKEFRFKLVFKSFRERT